MLKSLAEHNEMMIVAHQSGWVDMHTPRPNGIACPACGKELVDTRPYALLTSSPPKKDVSCQSCDYSGYRIA